jgi:DNA polymerase (family 10)
MIGHPGGRLFPMADITDLDWERIFRAAAYNQVALEINSHKSHPIFDDEKVRSAVALGVPIALNSDSHSYAMLDQSRFGISIARRAGLSCDQVINTWSPNHLQLWLNNRRKATSMER